MVNNPKILISRHAKQRVIERFIPHLVKSLSAEKKMQYAEKVIREIFKDAVYLSDDLKGIAFGSETHNAVLIIKNRTIITINKLNRENHGYKRHNRSFTG